MNVGKTLFSQVMDFVPWKSVERIVKRYDGDYRARSLSCGEIFRVLAFSQFTWRESLRDIEACLAANRNKLFHMGLSSVPARSTLAEALELRDWRIFHDIAMCLIAKARKLYAEDDCGLLEFGQNGWNCYTEFSDCRLAQLIRSPLHIRL